MIESRRARAYKMGDYIDTDPVQRHEPAPERRCTRCACLLRWGNRHAGGETPLCDPCHHATRRGPLECPTCHGPKLAGHAQCRRCRQDCAPIAASLAAVDEDGPRRLTFAEKARHAKYRLCACGRDYHRTTSAQCRACRQEERRTPGTRGSEICACGGAKKSGSARCAHCRRAAA